MPGSTPERNDGGWKGDSGLDVLVPPGSPCIACADGELVYSENGHTPWVEDQDPDAPGFQGPHSILLRLNQPFEAYGRTIRYAYYTHLASVEYHVPDGSRPKAVKAGQVLGTTGIGNRVPHLHFGLLTARSQGPGEYLTDRQVAALVWPPLPNPSSPPRAQHRSKLFLHDNLARGYSDGVEQGALDIRVRLEPRGKMFIWVNGTQVKGRFLTLDLAHD